MSRQMQREGLQDSGSRPVRAFPSEGTQVDLGQQREYMVLPQTMFRVLARQFRGIAAHPPDGRHGAASIQNVCWLQRAAGLPETGVLDRGAWDMLSRLYEVFVVYEQTDIEHRGGWG